MGFNAFGCVGAQKQLRPDFLEQRRPWSPQRLLFVPLRCDKLYTNWQQMQMSLWTLSTRVVYIRSCFGRWLLCRCSLSGSCGAKASHSHKGCVCTPSYKEMSCRWCMCSQMKLVHASFLLFLPFFSNDSRLFDAAFLISLYFSSGLRKPRDTCKNYFAGFVSQQQCICIRKGRLGESVQVIQH